MLNAKLSCCCFPSNADFSPSSARIPSSQTLSSLHASPNVALESNTQSLTLWTPLPCGLLHLAAGNLTFVSPPDLYLSEARRTPHSVGPALFLPGSADPSLVKQEGAAGAPPSPGSPVSAHFLFSLGPVALMPDSCKGRNAEDSSQESAHSVGVEVSCFE